MSDNPKPEAVFKGIAASPGIAYGQAFVVEQKELEIPVFKIDPSKRGHEIARFERALLETRQQITAVQQEISQKLGEDEARIFDAHLLVLEDQALIEESIRELDSTGYNIEHAVHQVGQRYVAAFDAIDDEYLRERASDIRDVVRRVLHNLTGETMVNLSGLVEGRILVTHDITPSESAAFDVSRILGIVTDVGSKTSHAVIMARSMKIPSVVGMGDLTRNLDQDDWVIVDGYDGVVIARPSEQTLFRYGKIQLQRKSFETKVLSTSMLPAETLDRRRINLLANIESADEAVVAKAAGADGIGLFRTEFLFLKGSGFPDEQDQFLAYRKVAETFGEAPVVIRTLDLGGDKPASDWLSQYSQESNPFLGFRAIRYCLENPEIFRVQLRAILRASCYGNVRLMYPMISGAEELKRANECLEEAKQELRTRGDPFDETIEVGSMIEIPSAAATSDILAQMCAFFSIGTNDLIQYLLAIDRLNEKTAHLYEPTHPAVLRTIRSVIDAAHGNKIKVSVCGEMAGDPIYVPLLLGLGADDLSVAPGSLPAVKYLIQNMKLSDAIKLARNAMKKTDPRTIEQEANQFYLDRIGSM
ncbi:MAG: phosphoenolpyruvate--protein phosphotransferase [Opitutaceae bacterium]